jgi:hypothetical protein
MLKFFFRKAWKTPSAKPAAADRQPAVTGSTESAAGAVAAAALTARSGRKQKLPLQLLRQNPSLFR